MLRWPAEAIWEAVAPLLPGFTVEVLPSIDSTNSELMRRARAGQNEPVLLVAEEQTAGRGRLGRPWQSRAGDSLTFSLGLPLAPADWSGLSLAVGVSLAESLAPSTAGGPAIGLKWPNDLWMADRKLAGILVETASVGEGGSGARFTVIGAGVNIAERPGEGLSTAPAWLREAWPEAGAPEALGRIALPLVQALQAFEAWGFAPFRERFHARDVLRERSVVLSDGTQGTAHGVSEDGGLLVHTAAGMKTITSSEVSVRPAPGRCAAVG